jgi:hypothetical protein
MKAEKYYRNIKVGGTAAIVRSVFLCAFLVVDLTLAQQKAEPPKNTTDESIPAVAAFKKRVDNYVDTRERLERKLPKLSKDATPEKIKEHELAFEALVQNERTGAKVGDVFTADISDHIRKTIQANFKGRKKERLKKTVLDEKPTEVKLRVNYLYPSDEKVVTMPPTLLLKLPELPKQLRYEFVGRHLILLDRETRLIIDYMTNALPQ